MENQPDKSSRTQNQAKGQPQDRGQSTFRSPSGRRYRIIHTDEVDDYQRPPEHEKTPEKKPAP